MAKKKSSKTKRLGGKKEVNTQKVRIKKYIFNQCFRGHLKEKGG